MKYIKSINEDFYRVAGFRYSEPKEDYKVSVICLGDVTEDKIKRGLSNVTNLKFNPDSIVVTNIDEDQVVNTPNGPIDINAIVEFVVTVYTDREVKGVVEELSTILSSAFDIEIVDLKYKKILDI